MCNQAASFNRCLFKVQKDMQTQLKTVRSERKAKGPSRASEAAEELQFLLEFNSSITQAAAKAMEHLTEEEWHQTGHVGSSQNSTPSHFNIVSGCSHQTGRGRDRSL